ncbi:MAG: c-type cytochrome [Deltaproteobacteria bacterium]|nr:c-type cytochrome [Deltaproteobacteria bacterium]
MKVKLYAMAALLCLTAILLGADQIRAADYSAGKAVFRSRCQGCHRIEGDGSYPSTFYKQYRPKDFSKSAAWENLSEEKIRFVLAKGHGVMRPVPLSADQSRALIDYMMHELKK